MAPQEGGELRGALVALELARRADRRGGHGAVEVEVVVGAAVDEHRDRGSALRNWNLRVARVVLK